MMFCKDCKHYEKHFYRNKIYHVCKRSTELNMVTGKPVVFDAEKERKAHNPNNLPADFCGKEARYFLPKE